MIQRRAGGCTVARGSVALSAGDINANIPEMTSAGQASNNVRACAFGDFRTYETTFASRATNAIFEVRLESTNGAVAHFACDHETAGHLARALESQLSSPEFRRRQSHPSNLPEVVPLRMSGTDVLFLADEHPQVELEMKFDRLFLRLNQEDAVLFITIQYGVADAIYTFLCRGLAGSGRTVTTDYHWSFRR